MTAHNRWRYRRAMQDPVPDLERDPYALALPDFRLSRLEYATLHHEAEIRMGGREPSYSVMQEVAEELLHDKLDELASGP